MKTEEFPIPILEQPPVMKQYILLLVLMVMGAGMTVHAEDVNPVKVGNVISGHIIEKGTEASLPYATILIVEKGQGTVSDENGEFVFKKILIVTGLIIQ